MLGDAAIYALLTAVLLMLLKTACLKYGLAVLHRIVSYALMVFVVLMCAALGLLSVLSWDEEVLHVNDKSVPLESTVDLGSGYYFMGGLPTIQYRCSGINGFVYRGNIGFIEKEGVFNTPDGVFMYAGEYTKEYIVARGVDYKGEVYYWLIMKNPDCILGPLSKDEIIIECTRKGITLMSIITIQRGEPFMLK